MTQIRVIGARLRRAHGSPTNSTNDMTLMPVATTMLAAVQPMAVQVMAVQVVRPTAVLIRAELAVMPTINMVVIKTNSQGSAKMAAMPADQVDTSDRSLQTGNTQRLRSALLNRLACQSARQRLPATKSLPMVKRSISQDGTRSSLRRSSWPTSRLRLHSGR